MDTPISPIGELIKKNEKTFVSRDQSVDYLLLKGSVFKDRLIVVFSAFNDSAVTTAKTYNYVRTLQDFDGNKLFIKDQCGPQGSYYLGQAPDYTFSKVTMDLIEHVRKELGVVRENVICIGSSKGGTCALYHGVVGGYGGIIAGAPQTKIASYALSCSKPTYEYMFGDNRKHAEEADRIVYKACDHELAMKVWVITSPLDWQYQEHVLPFLEEVGGNFQDLKVIVGKEMNSHNDIATYLVENLNHLLIDFILEISKQRWEVDLQNQLHAYNASEKEFFDETNSELKVPAGRALYVQTFDGTFDIPPKGDTNILLARMPPRAADAIVEIELISEANVTFNIFFMQYPREGGCLKTNKTWKCEAGKNLVHYLIPVASDVSLFKVALRFSSNFASIVKIRGVRLSFTSR